MTAPESPAAPSRAAWKIAGVSVAIMVVLALVGVGLATAEVGVARNYWMALVPVYGVLCTFTAWKHARAGEHLVLRQVLHWTVIAAAVALDFGLRSDGLETQLASGLNSLLLLAVGCFLAGVHLDWLFVLVGALLVLTLVLVAKADQYLWLLLLAAAAAVGVAAGARRLFSRAARAP